ncbi:hypothetical protein [Collinsella aerofaciens]|uniref:hypothetical protein n=1 Tax=Collinsella aerofaciens TaxID=74426 RepID=UPI00359CADF2
MDEDKLAGLNDVQDFFNRSHSTSASGTFCTEKIDIKDFIKWCNNPCNSISESGNVDSAYRLGQTICALNELSDDKIDEINKTLEDVAAPVISSTDLSLKEQNERLLENAREKLLEHDELHSKLKIRLGVWRSDLTETSKKDLPGNIAFYCALKLRLKDCPDEQGYYHYQFDDSGNTIARVDPLKPFFGSTHGNLNQQWHVLISVLAYLDVAHALSSDHHEYHYLYPYLSSYDKGDLSEGKLQLKSSLSLNVIRGRDYTSEPMMTWIKDALVKQEAK